MSPRLRLLFLVGRYTSRASRSLFALREQSQLAWYSLSCSIVSALSRSCHPHSSLTRFPSTTTNHQPASARTHVRVVQLSTGRLGFQSYRPRTSALSTPVDSCSRPAPPATFAAPKTSAVPTVPTAAAAADPCLCWLRRRQLLLPAEVIDGAALLETRIARAIRREGQPRLHEHHPVEVANFEALRAFGVVLVQEGHG